MKGFIPSWLLAGSLVILATISCQAFVLPSADMDNGAISGPNSDPDAAGKDDRRSGSGPAGLVFEEGMSASGSSAASPPDWEETKRMLVEYLDQGGDPWEIPEVPRLILISELGLQRGSPLSRADTAYVSEGSPKALAYKNYPALMADADDMQLERKRKRNSNDAGPSLSVVNHLDVLRQKLLLEMARRRMQKSQSQIIANQNLLRQIGKRSVLAPQHMEAHAHRN